MENAEDVLCQMLGFIDDTAYYWASGNTAEVDFVIQCEKNIVPIEVNSRKMGKPDLWRNAAKNMSRPMRLRHP